MNAYRGEGEIVLGGRSLPLRFNWTALAKIKQLFPDGWKADDVNHIAKLLEIGLAHLNDPTLTSEAIIELSPPLMPSVEALFKAQHRAWYGTEEAPKEEANANPPVRAIGSSDGGVQLSESASVVNGSGERPPSS